jgi:prepilin-type N-terminal cleavage/methylation domain-containing protein
VKKAFSLMEVIISIMILSTVMVALLQVKNENIFLIEKTNERAKLNDYIQISVDLKRIEKNSDDVIEQFLDKKYKFENDDIRKELKNIKVDIKEEKEKETKIKTDQEDLEIITYSRSYSIDDDIKKKIYNFKIKL